MTPIRKIFILPLRLYKIFVSPLLGPACRFYPTCSDYTAQALERHGVLKGLFLGARRLVRCHPWGGCGGVDPVPERFTWGHLIRYTGSIEKHSEDMTP